MSDKQIIMSDKQIIRCLGYPRLVVFKLGVWGLGFLKAFRSISGSVFNDNDIDDTSSSSFLSGTEELSDCLGLSFMNKDELDTMPRWVYYLITIPVKILFCVLAFVQLLSIPVLMLFLPFESIIDDFKESTSHRGDLIILEILEALYALLVLVSGLFLVIVFGIIQTTFQLIASLPFYLFHAYHALVDGASVTFIPSLLLGTIATGLTFMLFGLSPLFMPIAGTLGFLVALVCFHPKLGLRVFEQNTVSNADEDSKSYIKWTFEASQISWLKLSLAIPVVLSAGGAAAWFFYLGSAPLLTAAAIALPLVAQVAIGVGIALVVPVFSLIVLPRLIHTVGRLFRTGRLHVHHKPVLFVSKNTDGSVEAAFERSKLTGENIKAISPAGFDVADNNQICISGYTLDLKPGEADGDKGVYTSIPNML